MLNTFPESRMSTTTKIVATAFIAGISYGFLLYYILLPKEDLNEKETIETLPTEIIEPARSSDSTVESAITESWAVEESVNLMKLVVAISNEQTVYGLFKLN
jgi:hypothetical protein